MRTVVAKYPHAGLIDVGANIGDTLAVARSAADIPVVCVEGDPQCFAFLQQNIEQFERVSAHNVFLGEETERVSAQLQKEGWNTTIVPGDGTKKLSIIRFDEFANTLEQRDSLKILKIDAEGYDTIILRGAGEFLRDVRPALMFEYNRHNMHAIGEDGLGTLHWLGDLGYRKALFYEPKGRLCLSCDITDAILIRDLHEYADGWNAAISYFDICTFHQSDNDIAEVFVADERARRAARQGPSTT